MLPKREWGEMTWEDFSTSETSRWIAVLPLAATEQHGPHLPLAVDSFIAAAYLARVRALVPADLPVSFLPIQEIGQSDEHRAFPGTTREGLHVTGFRLARDVLTDRQSEILAARERLVERLKRMAG